MAVTIEQVQKVLAEQGLYKGDIDNKGGPLTAAAVVEFQKKHGLVETGKLDKETLAKLFPHKIEPPQTIKATFMDWVLNGITSKANQAAVAGVAAIIAWLSMRYGINLPPDVEEWITRGAVLAVGAVVVAIRTRFDSPHVADKAPAVIQKPAEFK